MRRRIFTDLIQYVPTGEIDRQFDADAWIKVMRGADLAIHLAARVHIMEDTASNPIDAFRQANLMGTERLVRIAAKSGIRRFIFLSTIKVNGERTNDKPFMESDAPDPRDAYAISKWEAELVLNEVGRRTGIEVVIIRPPLIYGPGVKANFFKMIQLIERGMPLPFGGIHNQRSLLSLTNLVDLIRCCLEHPAAAGETFMVSDRDDVSTPELVHRIARALGKPARLFSVPEWMAKFGGRVAGKSNQVKRLYSSLQIDSSKVRRVLGWMPPCSMSEELAHVAAWYNERR